MSVSRPAAAHGGTLPLAGRLRGFAARASQWIARHPDAAAYAAILGLVVIWHRGLIFDAGYLGMRNDWSVPPTAWQNAQLAAERLSAWQTNLFGFTSAERTMSLYMLFVSGGLAALAGLDGWLISRYPIALIALAGVFTYQAAKALGLARPAAFAAAVVYMTTPFLLDAYVTGYLPMFIGIALLPKALQAAHEAFEQPLSVRGFARGFVWIGLSASTIHLAVIVTAMVGIYAVVRTFTAPGSRRRRLVSLGSVAAMGTGVALLHSPLLYVLVDLASTTEGTERYAELQQEAQGGWINRARPTLTQALTLTGHPYNYSMRTPPPYESSSVLAGMGRGLLTGIGLAAAALTRGRARRLAVLALLGFLVFTLLGKGASEPLPDIPHWLRATPLGSIFRNSRYFTIPAGLLLALLAGCAVDQAAARPPGVGRRAAGTAVGAVIALSSLPFWGGNLLGYLPPFAINADTLAVMTNVRDLPGADRMVHVPMLGPGHYVSRSGRESQSGNNPFVLQPPKPSITFNSRPTLNAPYTTTLFHGLYNPSRYPVDRLLAFGRVRHVLFDPHWVSDYYEFIAATGEPQVQWQELGPRPAIALEGQPGLRRLDAWSVGEVELFEVAAPPAQRLGVPARVVIGSPSLRPLVTAWHAFDAPGSVTLASGEAGVLGRGGAHGVGVRLGTEIWLGADPADLTAAYLPGGATLGPHGQVWPRGADASAAWVFVNQHDWWHADPEAADLTRGLVTKADGAAFAITAATTGATSELWIRHFVSPEGSALEVELDGRAVGRIPTRSQAVYGYRWSRVAAPTAQAGPHTIQVRTDGAGLNAVSRVGLLAAADVQTAEREAERALARLPSFTVLPDLAVTDGVRAFRLPRSGAYTLRLAVRPGVDPTIHVDGAPVGLRRIGSASGFDLLAGTAELDAGVHRLTLRTAPPPAPVVRVTHRPPGAAAFRPCASRTCEGVVRVQASVPADGRTVSFSSRVTTGVEPADVTVAQLYPHVTHAVHRQDAERQDTIVRQDAPLDPGSNTAVLEARNRQEDNPQGDDSQGDGEGLSLELLDVEVSRLPHGLSVVLAHEPPAAAPAAAVLIPTQDEPTLAAAAYQGAPGERLVRLDERFDRRWTLHVNGAEVDAQRHVVLDGHVNGWAVDLRPGDRLTASFTLQTAYVWIQAANLGLLAGMVIVGWARAPRLRRRRG